MSHDRPLTRRELRERERAGQSAPGGASAAVAESMPMAATAREPQPAPASSVPAIGDPRGSASIDPVEWRLSTADMSHVRDALDSRVEPGAAASAGFSPGQTPPEMRRGRRTARTDERPAALSEHADDSTAVDRSTQPGAVPTRAHGVESPAAPIVPQEPRTTSAQTVPVASAATATTSVAELQTLALQNPQTVQFGPPDDGPLSGERVRSLPGTAARSSPQPAFGYQPTSPEQQLAIPQGQPAVLPEWSPRPPATGHDQGNPVHPAAVDAGEDPAKIANAGDASSADGQADLATKTTADDYFERLAMASADDAPTGMIVMPEIVNPDITGAISRSGDVMVTGSMRVSRDLSSLGAYRDGLDQWDDESGIVTDGMRGDHDPVRARDAVAAHRTTGVRLPSSPDRQLGTWIWVVTAAIGVAVVGGASVLLFGVMSGWF